MRPIVRAENLSKQFQIRHDDSTSRRYHTLRESLAGALRHPLKRFRTGQTSIEQIWAIQDVSFDVMPGEAMGIIGPNGAGKSTLLKVLSRVLEPTSGRALLYGRVASLLEVGTGFHPDLSGRENVYLNGAILGMKRREIGSRFDEIVAFAEVERFIDTAVKHYSSGMYGRLAFAVAAHLNPDILIVDEVLSVGDAHFQKKCLSKMNDVVASGRTVLFISHSMDMITRFCQQAILLTNGKVNKIGAARDVVDHYRSLEV